ncbi:Mannan endo-1,6-alpha-mannosidase [Pleurostoma richardsiae]|uniref:Mannan endo-1,6-alpha-mannosidase n=1 Tax=Pleurostoma richardsiae TaxID=41990 RepID=A0AA38RIZ4_9PEZI|nr:Mannan endo-1,6-alpha-mannosidase [Pleurostoma richardsiae]
MVSFYDTVYNTVAAITALSPKDLRIGNTASVQGVAKTLAAGAMSYYYGNATTFVDLPTPYYWWECGALIGAMLDYSHYTNDSSYDKTLTTALLAQVGPDFDFMLPSHYGDEGNDDQAFWGFAILAAAERNLLQPNATVPSWLQLGENIWNSLTGRWNTTNCGGGLLWQIFASNPNGLNYKNSVSNGGLFQISARLYRATNNQTYLDWAEKVYDWSVGVGFVDSSFNVYDGASAEDNCAEINPLTFSYSLGIYLYGAAVMANATGNSTWVDRTAGFVRATESFFSPFDNATNIMYEHACEEYGTCNTDMLSFKGYLSRFMWAATLMVPDVLSEVEALLHPSATAAANACSGGLKGTTCGQKWYVGGFDNHVGLGQEMCALETVHGLLVGQAAPPLSAGEIEDVRTTATATSTLPASTTASATSTPSASKNAAMGGVMPDQRWAGLGVIGALAWGLV